MRNNSSRRHSRGFTLVELIISIVLIGILAAVGSTMLVDSFTTSRMVNADNASKAHARYALERLAREIREIKYDTTNNLYCIRTPTSTYMTASNLAFYKTTPDSAYTSTCATNANLVTIGYVNPGVTLQYSSPALTATLNSQVSSFSLAYLDSNGCATTLINNSVGTTDCTTRGGIRFVVITLTMTDPTSGQSISERTRVSLRNA